MKKRHPRNNRAMTEHADGAAEAPAGEDDSKARSTGSTEATEQEVCALRACGRPLDPEHRATVRVRCPLGTALEDSSATVVAWRADGRAALHRECWAGVSCSLPLTSAGTAPALFYAPRLRQQPSAAERAALAEADRTAEHFDAGVVLRDKAAAAAALLLKAARCVAFTGAGVSTSAGISDFRGPDGRWTRLAQERSMQQQRARHSSRSSSRGTNSDSWRSLTVSEMNQGTGGLLASANTGDGDTQLGSAQPTAAHKALAQLVEQHVVELIITQNVDGLHQASGVPADAVVELHGNAFTEQCGVSHQHHHQTTKAKQASNNAKPQVCLCFLRTTNRGAAESL